MPLYEYECEACRRRFEIIRKFSDPPVERCEVCGGAVRKLLSSPAIQFKGSGWYITDYARKSDSTSSPSGAGSGDQAAKADPKPAGGDAKPKGSSD
jgi:putative FmdB family regulatory protein